MKKLTFEQHQIIAGKLELIKTLQWQIKETLELSGFKKSDKILLTWRQWEMSKQEKNIKSILDDLYCRDCSDKIEEYGFIYYRSDFIP